MTVRQLKKLLDEVPEDVMVLTNGRDNDLEEVNPPSLQIRWVQEIPQLKPADRLNWIPGPRKYTSYINREDYPTPQMAVVIS